jgi:hypothetical protein
VCGKPKKDEERTQFSISSHDAKILANAKKRAYKLDSCLNFLGFRFGWSSVVGLVPVVGDIVDALLTIRLILVMCGVGDGLPNNVFAWMVINMVVDFAVGLIPFVGDFADAAIKCNSKNVRLLEEHLNDKREANEKLFQAFLDAEHARMNKLTPTVQRVLPAYSRFKSGLGGL